MNERYSYFEGPDFLKKQNELKLLSKKIGETENMFKEKNKFDDPYDFNLDYFGEKKEFQKLGIGKDPNYMNPLTANNDTDIKKGIDYMNLGSSSDKVSDTNKGTTENESGGMGIGAIGNILGGVGDVIKTQTKNPYNNSNYVDEQALKDESREQGVGKVKDGVASAVGPFGQLFRGIEKMGNGIGDSIGGEAGAGVSALFSPDEAIMANNSDPDVKGSDKVLGMLVPVYAGVSAERAKNKRKKEWEKKQFEIEQAKREQEQRMKDGKDSLEKLTALRKAQLGYMI